MKFNSDARSFEETVDHAIAQAHDLDKSCEKQRTTCSAALEKYKAKKTKH